MATIVSGRIFVPFDVYMICLKIHSLPLEFMTHDHFFYQAFNVLFASGRSSPDASISKMPQSTNQQSSQADPLEPSQRLLVDFVMRRLDIISSGEDLAKVGGVPGEVLNLQSQEDIVLELMQCLPIVKDSQLVLVKALTALERERMVNEQPPSSIKDAGAQSRAQGYWVIRKGVGHFLCSLFPLVILDVIACLANINV